MEITIYIDPLDLPIVHCPDKLDSSTDICMFMFIMTTIEMMTVDCKTFIALHKSQAQFPESWH